MFQNCSLSPDHYYQHLSIFYANDFLEQAAGQVVNEQNGGNVGKKMRGNLAMWPF